MEGLRSAAWGLASDPGSGLLLPSDLGAQCEWARVVAEDGVSRQQGLGRMLAQRVMGGRHGARVKGYSMELPGDMGPSVGECGCTLLLLTVEGKQRQGRRQAACSGPTLRGDVRVAVESLSAPTTPLVLEGLLTGTCAGCSGRVST